VPTKSAADKEQQTAQIYRENINKKIGSRYYENISSQEHIGSERPNRPGKQGYL
jgi:hypothetical protein